MGEIITYVLVLDDETVLSIRFRSIDNILII